MYDKCKCYVCCGHALWNPQLLFMSGILGKQRIESELAFRENGQGFEADYHVSNSSSDENQTQTLDLQDSSLATGCASWFPSDTHCHVFRWDFITWKCA